MRDRFLNFEEDYDDVKKGYDEIVNPEDAGKYPRIKKRNKYSSQEYSEEEIARRVRTKNYKRETPRKEYESVCNQLFQVLANNKSSLLNQPAIDVYLIIDKIVHSKSAELTIAEATTILQRTIEVVKGRETSDTSGDEYQIALEDLHQCIGKVSSFSYGKALGGALLALLGAAILVASGVVAALSFGLATPISVLGFVFGASILMGGISAGAGLLGASCLMFSGGLLANTMRDHPLNQALNTLETTGRLLANHVPKR